ncbi:DUF4255 domain-containing protein [Frankia sp. ACN1ag]|uniref:DUF4255 domain-containing protein n=1 Tax=Frankia sp. ACN1ag TaxID=102891 RepID=UPI0006DC1006|nr:DUF4255 domain-containing protein [Frankia sp. ACN1ag]
MSNPLAVAAVTQTLKVLLSRATPNVTTLPLDKARPSGDGDQLNIFLYQTVLSAAWRNADPVGARPGERSSPPLALCLHYLVTAYGGNEADAHVVLGRAMSILHDHTTLSAAQIRDATTTDLPDSDLHRQAEGVRITPLVLSTDDLFKLWSGFQTAYRVSAAYEVSVVLIDSSRPPSSPPPVLTRGEADRGPVAVAGAAPVLASATPDGLTPVVSAGSTVRLRGTGLATDAATAARFTSARLPTPIDLPLDAVIGGSGERTVGIPADPAALTGWVPGQYTVAVVSTVAGVGTWLSNEVPIAIGSTITMAPLHAVPGTVNLTITCLPRPRPEQRLLVIFGNRQIPIAADAVVQPADPALPSTITVAVAGVTAGTYVVRLRVDGADSDPTTLAGRPPVAVFADAATVVVA